MGFSPSRLPAVQSLSAILAHGTEGGKEFARVVGLLLFQDARRNGVEFSMFDDASGDYQGLDSFSRPTKSNKATGYQYKFFPSPLSDAHRREIKSSIAKAKRKSKELKLVKYVVVTPDDLKNSGRREGGGDVEWFEKLRLETRDEFELEHFGHTKLQSLFLQTPHLCLFYYPSLVPSGYARRKTIQEVRSQYDANLKKRFGRIEFVGMSVYKEEASRRIPLEDIYIPLSVVSERASEEDDDTPRVDPAKFLVAGNKTVILGDPGSGKSTLVAFLALVGISEALQQRCQIVSDGRLTIVVTLRRYADELKERRNLPLLDYIVESTRADFGLDAFNTDFLEYYFESGQAVLLFDGLDELPGSGFKSVVRTRIEAFIENYPANTVVVTSRIVGYEAEVRFDDAFSHYRVAKLRLSEIERFIVDWYAARIEDEIERTRNADDLVKVITNRDNDAIRDLARNPLLLTIVALVHRIDAVLPDQRVVLYHKCTETLLNTWYKAKRRDDEIAKGRIERRNRLRVEAIAYWMHRRSLGEGGRSVAPYDELLAFLTNHINKSEPPLPSGDTAEDQAEDFLEFIKSGAGLLVEAGDKLYSFIHMTFQEYLSATHLTSYGEIGGTQSIWDELGGDLENPRWREVVRLLVASLRSPPAQKFFVEKLLNLVGNGNLSRDGALLLMGLLRDGIEPAEEQALEIVKQTLTTLQSLTDPDDILTVQSSIRAWTNRDKLSVGIGGVALNILFEKAATPGKLTLSLTRSSLDLPPADSAQLAILERELGNDPQLQAYKALILGRPAATVRWPDIVALHDLWATDSPQGNLCAAIGLCLSILLEPEHVPRRLLARELTLLPTSGYGPHSDHFMNLLSVALPAAKLPPEVINALGSALGPMRRREANLIVRAISPYMNGLITFDEGSRNEDFSMLEGLRGNLREKLKKAKIRVPRLKTSRSELHEDLALISETFRDKLEEAPTSFWQMVRSSEIFSEMIIPSIAGPLGLKHLGHWQEALRISLRDRIPQAISRYLDVQEWRALAGRLTARAETSDDLDFAAWLALFDLWIWERDGYHEADQSPLRYVLEAARNRDHPSLQFVLAVRGVCHQVPDSGAELQRLTADPKSQIVTLLTGLGWPQPNGKVTRTSVQHPKKRRSVVK